MIQLENVYKSYRQGGHTVTALRGVNLNIEGTGYFAIMGRSGSGKSTLLHLLAGLDQADQGTVIVDGQNLGQLPEKALTLFRRRRIGMVFQSFNLIPTLTAAQNIALPGVIDGKARRWIDDRAHELLAALGLSQRATHRPDALSGGEQQRVAIARALLFAPPVLLADEPTGNLDSTSSELLWRQLGELARKQQMTVVLVTHEPAAAVHCEKVFVLGDGVCKGVIPTETLDASSLAHRCEQLSR